MANEMQRLLAFQIDADKEVVHISEASYLEAMQNKYGRVWSYYSMITDDLKNGTPSWDVQEHWVIGSSRPVLSVA